MTQDGKQSLVRWTKRILVALIALPLISILIFISLLIHALTPLPDPRFDIVGEVEKLIEDDLCESAITAVFQGLLIPDPTMLEAAMTIVRTPECDEEPGREGWWAYSVLSYKIYVAGGSDTFDWNDADFLLLREKVSQHLPDYEILSWTAEYARRGSGFSVKDAWTAEDAHARHRFHFPERHWSPGWAGRYAMRDIIFNKMMSRYQLGLLEDASLQEHYVGLSRILHVARCEIPFQISPGLGFFDAGLRINDVKLENPVGLKDDQKTAWKIRIAECDPFRSYNFRH